MNDTCPTVQVIRTPSDANPTGVVIINTSDLLTTDILADAEAQAARDTAAEEAALLAEAVSRSASAKPEESVIPVIDPNATPKPWEV